MKSLILRFELLAAITFVVHAVSAAPGDVDLSFDPGSGVNEGVHAMAVQPDGKIVIGGFFRTVKGLVRNRVARLNADGSGDTSFDPGSGIGVGYVLSVALQPDGTVLVGGQFTTVNGIGHTNLARLNPDGSLDGAFNPGIGDRYHEVDSVAVQPDGKILIGGHFTSVNGTSRTNIARLNADGTLDTNFDPGTGPDNLVYSIALQPDGKVITGGWFNKVNGIIRNRLARLNANGSVDGSFNQGAVEGSWVESIAVQPDGKVLIAGIFDSLNNVSRRNIARLNPNGSVDVSFALGSGIGSGYVFSVALQPDGKVLIGGSFDMVNGLNRSHIARLNPNGSVDTSFDSTLTGGFPVVQAIALQPDGKLLISGGVKTVNGISRYGIARLDPDGSPDTGFKSGHGLDGGVRSVALQPDGKVLIIGGFEGVNGVIRPHLARLNPNGSVDPTFNQQTLPDPGNAYSSLNAFALQPDGKMLVSFMADSMRHLVRINGDGSLDVSFNPAQHETQFSTSPGPITVQSDGKVLLGGRFWTVNGVSRASIARLNEDGSLDDSFNPSITSWGGVSAPDVSSILVQPNGKILIIGTFIAVNDIGRTNFARLNEDGSLDDSFNPSITPWEGSNSPYLPSIFVQPNGKVLINGTFIAVNDIGRTNFARLNQDGTLDTGFDPGTGPDRSVYSIAVQPDGKVVIGGEFTSVSGTSRNGIARLNADGRLDTSFNPGTGADGIVSSLVLQPDGRLVIGGTFGSVNGITRNYVARLWGDSPVLGFQKLNNQLVLTWTNAALTLQSALAVTGPFTNLHAATSPYTNPFTAPQQFFRIISN